MKLYICHFLLASFAWVFFIYKNTIEATTLDARPTTLKYSGDNVTLTWRDVDSPSKYDWLGIYMPATSAIDEYIGYIFLSTCPTWSTGTCSLHIPLINMRSPYKFRIFRGAYINVTANLNVSKEKNSSITHNISMVNGKNVSRLDDAKNIELLNRGRNSLPSVSKQIAVSSIIHFYNYNEPTQIHLALTATDATIRVMFVTRDPIKSKVRFGSSEDDLQIIVDANSLTYSQTDMCDEPASSIGWRDPGYIHNAIMEGLSYGRRYYYQVGSNVEGWSLIYNFIAPNPRADETNALLFGDMGTYVPYSTFHYTQSECKNTMKWLQRDLEEIGDKPSFISHLGDISYACGYSWIWDTFFFQIQPIAAKSPYHVCIGNHEYDWPKQPFKPMWSSYDNDSGGECGVPYSMHFIMPGNSSLSTGTSSPNTTNLYYSINVGVVHFLFYSTEIDFQPETDQYAFIANDLRNVDRKETPFVVFLGHRPLYTTDYRASLDSTTHKLIQTFEPLLIETKVNLAFCAHVHKYERMCSLQNYTCVEPSKTNGKLPIHMVIGMGGHAHQPVDDPLEGHPNVSIFPQPIWSIFRTFEWGYIRLHATRHLMTISYVGNHDGKIHDMVEIPCLDDLKSGVYVEPQQSIFDTSNIKPLPLAMSKNVFPFLFIFGIGCSIGVGGAIFYKRNQEQHAWVPLNHEEASTSNIHL